MRRDGRIVFEEELARGFPKATILDTGEVINQCAALQVNPYTIKGPAIHSVVKALLNDVRYFRRAV